MFVCISNITCTSSGENGSRAIQNAAHRGKRHLASESLGFAARFRLEFVDVVIVIVASNQLSCARG